MANMAKAAEAVREKLERICEEDCFPDEDCTCCKLDELKYQVRWCEDVARAVLEAAGISNKELLERVLALEREAHRLWDDAFQNIAFANLTPSERQRYIEQTYQATSLHRQAVEVIETAIQRAGKEA